MALQPNQRLGPYEILSAVGAGGMGEVYRARDTRLDRTVAIKILPDYLADRAELRERFEREARTVASLNHSHICTLFDIGRQDGTDYLVMEYLEGETLAQRLTKGPLPLDQVLRYAIEIADALDKAHRKGITHRDLKPGNIMLTKSGTKLLDFGLAKLKQEVAPANVQLSQLPTAGDPLTAQGTIVGTLQYMAPEQLEGKEVDARTDIFAFGTVVYEMATSKRAFEGKSQASLIAKILETDPPPISSLQPMTPPALDRVVRKCLAKEPEKRWQAASDVCDELEWIAEGGPQAGVPGPTIAAVGLRVRGKRALLSGGTSLLLAAIIGFMVWNLKPAPAPSTRPVSRFTITLPQGQQLAGLNIGTAVAISPDGAQLAYVASQGGTQQLYLRAMNRLEARPIANTDGAANPFFSPDGQWLGFFAGGKLKKVSAAGEAAVTLGDAANPRGASWGSQGIIAFVPTNTLVIQQVSDAGGAPRPLTRFENEETAHRWPDFLPGGQAMLFAGGSGANFGTAQIIVQSASGERRKLIEGGTNPRYALSGHLVYEQGGDLMAVPFDPQRLELTGKAVPVVEKVLQSQGGGAQYGISDTGSLVYVSGGVEIGRVKMVWVSRNGTEQPLAAPAQVYRTPRLSPDGQRATMPITEEDGRDTQIWLYDFSRDALTRLTFGGTQNQYPVWTPDGKRITFESNEEGVPNLFWQLAGGDGVQERLTASEYTNIPSSWSPDGQLLAFQGLDPTTRYDIWVLRLSDHKAEPFLRTPANEGAPQFSPDGHWLAYVSDQSGRNEVYVQPYPGPGGKWQISTEGGAEPAWNRNGRELFYRSGDKMMAVDIAMQSGFAAGKPKMLFEGAYVASPLTFSNYDVSPDGQRFLMLKPVEQAEAAPTQIVVVQNWFEELKQKVPVGNK
jgi:Tol biopolymer transport system component/predicted Ser/Thr protein kinase